MPDRLPAPCSCGMKLNLDYLLEMLWEALALTCIYTKKRGRKSDRAPAPPVVCSPTTPPVLGPVMA